MILCKPNPLDGERRRGSVGRPLPERRSANRRRRRSPAARRRDRDDPGPRRRACSTATGICPRSTARRVHGRRLVPDRRPRILSDRRLRLDHRARKDLIISGGYNVYPAEVEAPSTSSGRRARSAVVGVPHPDFGEASPHSSCQRVTSLRRRPRILSSGAATGSRTTRCRSASTSWPSSPGNKMGKVREDRAARGGSSIRGRPRRRGGNGMTTGDHPWLRLRDDAANHLHAGQRAPSCEHLPRGAARRVLVVTDRGLVDGGIVAPVLASLADGGLEILVFDGSPRRPAGGGRGRGGRARAGRAGGARRRARRRQRDGHGEAGGAASDRPTRVDGRLRGRPRGGPAAPAGGGADHGGNGLRGDAHRDRHDAGQREGGCRLAAAVPRRRGAGQHPHPGAAAVGDRDDRRGRRWCTRSRRSPAGRARTRSPTRSRCAACGCSTTVSTAPWVRATMSTPASRCSSAR